MTGIEFVAFVYMPIAAMAAVAFVYWCTGREDAPKTPRHPAE